MQLVVIFLLIGAFFGTPHPVRAELPPHDPKMLQPDPSNPKAQLLPDLFRGVMEFYTSQFSDSQAVPIILGTDFGYHLEDIIIPYKDEDDKNIANPEYEAFAEFTENYRPMLAPQHATEKKIRWSEINQNVQSNGFCARIFNNSQYSNAQEDISSTGLQVSENVPYSQRVFENFREINALTGLGEMEMTNGYYDYNSPREMNSVKDFSPYCMMKRPSTTYVEEKRPVVQLATFGGGSINVMGYVTETITHTVVVGYEDDGTPITKEEPEHFNPKYKVYLTEVTAFPSEWWGLAGDPWGKELMKTKHEFLKILKTTRGFTFGNIPEHRSQDVAQKTLEKRSAQTIYDYSVFGLTDGDVAGVQVYGADQQKETQHGWFLQNNAKYRTIQAACDAVPQELLESQNISLASGKNGIPLHCGPPEEAPSTTSNQFNAPACQENPFDKPLTGGDINQAIAQAAAANNIPECVLNGVANIEGAFDSDQCSINECGAIGPFAITTDHTYSDDNGQCVVDTDCNQCAAKQCPNTLATLPQYTETDMCDRNKSADAAAKILKMKSPGLNGTDDDVPALAQAIITAGDGYFGSSHTFTSGDNIVPGCSYGESLLVGWCQYSNYTCKGASPTPATNPVQPSNPTL
ncbi:MAG TPA: hypothetical protein VJB96_03235 [Patescibacteria group bacterium]|nr:hypothetical protein [Patescibacteria group bacterium]